MDYRSALEYYRRMAETSRTDLLLELLVQAINYAQERAEWRMMTHEERLSADRHRSMVRDGFISRWYGAFESAT